MINNLEAIHLLEDKLTILFSNYEFLLKENEVLLQNINNLQQEVLEKSQLIKQLEKDFSILRIAKTIEGSDNSSKETKLKINALVKEIDKCIAQLNE